MFTFPLTIALLLGLLGSLPCQAGISDAEAVNRAGMQRMLSQRIAKTYLMIGTDTRVDLAASQLDNSIASVEENAQWLDEYAADGDIRKALNEATDTWHQYRQLALSRPDRSQSAELLRLIAKGQSNKMIARKLGITEGTVKVHVKNLLHKLGLRSRVEAAVWVLENEAKG